MSIVQCVVIAVVCTGAAAPGGIVLPQITGDWFSEVCTAVVAGAAGLLGGGTLVLAAMLMVELVPRRKIDGEVPQIAV